MTGLRVIAEEVALETGAFLREAFLNTTTAYEIDTKSSATDLVSNVDLAAEELIRKRLREVRPDDGILGEEGGSVAGSSGLRWVVDPLDGTINFLYGIPQWCVSIACEDAEGNALVGVVYDPLRNELWAASADGPPLLNGDEVRPSTCGDLSHALLATGFGYQSEVREVQAEVLTRLLPRVRDIRRHGSAALDLAWTAGGRWDIYFESNIQHWDIAAGVLICERAGLRKQRVEFEAPVGPGLIVGPHALIPQILPLVTSQSHLGS